MMFDISKREKYILLSGAVFLVFFFGFQLGVAPVFKNQENLNRILIEKQAALEEMLELQQKYFSVSNSFDTKNQALINKDKTFSLFSFLDALAQQSGVKENVAYMKPFTKEVDKSDFKLSTVKVKLNAVYLKELIDFLFMIESSQNGVAITSLSLSKAGKDKVTIDAVIETQTLIPSGKV